MPESDGETRYPLVSPETIRGAQALAEAWAAASADPGPAEAPVEPAGAKATLPPQGDTETPGLRALARRNQDRMAALKRQGVELPGAVLVELQLEVLRSFLFGRGGPLEGQGGLFAETMNKSLSDLLDNVESQLAKAKLTQNVQPNRKPLMGSPYPIPPRFHA